MAIAEGVVEVLGAAEAGAGLLAAPATPVRTNEEMFKDLLMDFDVNDFGGRGERSTLFFALGQIVSTQHSVLQVR